MTTTGTTTFTVSAADVITEALEQLEVLDPGTSPLTADNTTCMRSLNFMIKRLTPKTWWLWKYTNINFALVSGVQSYSIGPSGANVTADRPFRIASAYLNNTNNTPANTIELQPLARHDYGQLSIKTSPGTPNQFYYDPQIPLGVISFYPVINTTGYTAILYAQTPMFDMTATTDNFDVPQELFEVLSYGLAYRIAPKYGAKSEKKLMMKQLYDEAINEMADAFQEEGPTSFVPDFQLTQRG